MTRHLGWLRFSLLVTLAAALSGCAPLPPLSPPVETAVSAASEGARSLPLERFHLVDLRVTDPTILVDLRYRESDNLSGRALYPPDMPCLVYSDTARRLRRAQQYLRAEGYGLKIWDAWRPPSVQRKLWEASPHGEWVAQPVKKWSHHCFATAVDATLVDSGGVEQIMPTGFDEFTEDASYQYRGDNVRIARNLRLLQEAMGDAGFKSVTSEWWHFNDTKSGRAAELIYAAELGIRLPE